MNEKIPKKRFSGVSKASSFINKSELRSKLRKIRDSIDFKARSKNVISKLEANSYFIKASKIMVYISFGSEVDTISLIKKYFAKKQFYVPVVDFGVCELYDLNDCVENKYGILEPRVKKEIDVNDLDLIILPGVGFDKSRRRLGYGSGYYDKLLKDCDVKTIALAFDCQIIDKLPEEKHDRRVDLLIAERKNI